LNSWSCGIKKYGVVAHLQWHKHLTGFNNGLHTCSKVVRGGHRDGKTNNGSLISLIFLFRKVMMPIKTKTKRSWFVSESRPRLSIAYRACHWTKGSQLQRRQRKMHLWAIKIHSTTAFRGETKPSAPCLYILRLVKEHCGVWNTYFAGKIHGHFSTSFFLLCY
jgi:hypothetical protein